MPTRKALPSQPQSGLARQRRRNPSCEFLLWASEDPPVLHMSQNGGQPFLPSPQRLDVAFAMKGIEAPGVRLPHLQVVPLAHQADPKPGHRVLHSCTLRPQGFVSWEKDAIQAFNGFSVHLPGRAWAAHLVRGRI